jgi:hypothetical protein
MGYGRKGQNEGKYVIFPYALSRKEGSGPSIPVLLKVLL